MELADLTRGMRKNEFLEPENLIFAAKPGLSEFRAVSAHKKTFWSPVQGLTPKKNAKRRISNFTYKQ